MAKRIQALGYAAFDHISGEMRTTDVSAIRPRDVLEMADGGEIPEHISAALPHMAEGHSRSSRVVRIPRVEHTFEPEPESVSEEDLDLLEHGKKGELKARLAELLGVE